MMFKAMAFEGLKSWAAVQKAPRRDAVRMQHFTVLARSDRGSRSEQCINVRSKRVCHTTQFQVEAARPLKLFSSA